MDYDQLMKKARETNASRDQIDGGLRGLPVFVQVATAMDAIRAGMITDDWDCVAEGQAMLQSLWSELRGVN